MRDLDTMAAALRAGSSLTEAVASSGPTGRGAIAPAGTVLDLVRQELARGAGLTEACRRHAVAAPPGGHAAGRPTDRLVAGALAVAGTGGGRLAQAVDATADAVREQLTIAADVRAQAAQATLSAAVLAVTPLVFTAWTAGGDATIRHFLLGDPLGVACLTTGLALDAVGAWWMVRLCRAAAR